MLERTEYRHNVRQKQKDYSILETLKVLKEVNKNKYNWKFSNLQLE